MGTPEYETRFIGRAGEIPGLASFRFERPDGYSFEPGQFLSLTLETRDGAQTKHFTHSSAPGDPWLELTTRLTGSAFKDALLALVPGAVVRLAGPRGILTLPEGTRKVAFLVGGVGVTPARSMVRDAVQRGTGLRVLMFYGNMTEDVRPFRDEFAADEAAHPEIRVVDVIAQPTGEWQGERGFITADLVRRYVDPLDGWEWVSSGPPAMVDAMRGVLAGLEVPQERIHLESFAGYE